VPTIFSHPAVVLAVAPWFRRVRPSLIVVAAICSSLPDADTAAFGYGIPYGHPLGHRGITHSLLFALLFSLAAAFAYARLTREPFRLAFVIIFIALVSHGLLDAMTTGGKGVGFFIPFDNRRYFLPFRPIRVSPIGIDFADKATVVLKSELLWVWLPSAAVAGVALVSRALARRNSL